MGDDTIHTNSNASNIDDYITKLPLPFIPPALPQPHTELGRTTTYDGNSKTETISICEGLSTIQLAAFSPNADVLWAGSIIKGDSIYDGLLTPVALDRNQGWITIGNIGNPVPNSQPISLTISVKEPSLASVSDEVRELLSKHISSGVAARVGQIQQQYWSIEQAALHLNASGKWLTGSVRAGLEMNNSSKYSHFMIQFVQSYYDISFNPFQKPSDAFRSGLFNKVTVEDIKLALGKEQVMPAYVSTITYGRMMLLSLSSQEKAESVNAYLNLVISGVAAGGEFDAKLMNSSFIRETEFRVLVLGGPTEPVVNLLKGPEALKKLSAYYNDGINFNVKTPAVPISYQLRWLGNKDQARLNFSTNYQVQKISPQRVVRFGIRLQTLDDDKDPGDIVSASIYKDNYQIWRLDPIAPPHHCWDNHTRQPDPSDADFGGVPGWFSAPPTVDIYTNEIGSIRVYVGKTGDRKWKFTACVALWLEDGKTIVVIRQEGRRCELGNDNITVIEI